MLSLMRSHRRRLPVEHVMIAGRAADLDDLRAALAVLPADAYGQVFVAASADATRQLRSPARVTIHRVSDETLANAVEAWIAEWAPCRPDPQRRVAVWLGAHARAALDTSQHGLEDLVDRL